MCTFLRGVFQAGKTALHLACSGGHVSVVGKLLNVGFDIDDRDEVGSCADYLDREIRFV